MKLYTISNDSGRTAVIRLRSHRQHIWSESEAYVTAAIKTRIIKLLGPGPYRNPKGNFGRAQRVFLVAT